MFRVALLVAVLAHTAAADAEIVKLWDKPKRLTFNFEQIALSRAAATIAMGFGAGPVSVEDGERKVDFAAKELMPGSRGSGMFCSRGSGEPLFR